MNEYEKTDRSTGHKPTHYNVIQIVAHDLGKELGCYGRAACTPNLDALSNSGVHFKDAVTSSTPCSPARGVLMTGMYAHRNGLIGLVNAGWTLPSSVPTIVDYFNRAGYETVLSGFQHECRRPEELRYRKLLSSPPPDWTGSARPFYYVENVVDAALDYLQGRQEDRDKPFYLNMGLFEAHDPWDREQYNPFTPNPGEIDIPPFMADVPALRNEYAGFLGGVGYMDDQLGRFLDWFYDSPLAQNTILLFTTDHGIAFPRAKTSLYEPNNEVALIVRPPGGGEGRVIDTPVTSIDLLPTLLDWCGLPEADGIDGRSYLPLLRGESCQVREHLFFERNFHDNFDPIRAVRSGRYKYIRNFAERLDAPMPWEGEPCASRDSFWDQHADRKRPEEELYDLAEDPNEFKNLAGDPSMRSHLERLREVLEHWMAESGDFLAGAHGPVFRPAQEVGHVHF